MITPSRGSRPVERPTSTTAKVEDTPARGSSTFLFDVVVNHLRPELSRARLKLPPRPTKEAAKGVIPTFLLCLIELTKLTIVL
jgi:hypothetical protein